MHVISFVAYGKQYLEDSKMNILNTILGIIVVGTGALVVLLFCFCFVWGIAGSIKEHRRIKKEKKAQAS